MDNGQGNENFNVDIIGFAFFVILILIKPREEINGYEEFVLLIVVYFFYRFYLDEFRKPFKEWNLLKLVLILGMFLGLLISFFYTSGPPLFYVLLGIAIVSAIYMVLIVKFPEIDQNDYFS